VDVDGDGSGLLGERIGEVKEVEDGKEVEDLCHRDIGEDARIGRFVVEEMEGAETGFGPLPRSGVPARGKFGCMVRYSRERGRKFPGICYAASLRGGHVRYEIRSEKQP